MNKNNTDLVRVNVVFDVALLEKIDSYRNSLGLNRSNAVRLMCNQYLKSQDTMQAFTDMMQAYKAEQMKTALNAYVDSDQ